MAGDQGSRDGSPRRLREINDRAALEALLAHGPLTRGELEGVIGLSKPATSSLLTRLEDAGTVHRGDLREGTRGPRAQVWRINGGLAYVAGVSLTPETAEITVADLSGTTLAVTESALPNDADAVPAAFAEAVAAAAGKVNLRPGRLTHVVVGSPGAVDPATGHLGFAPHLPGWEGFDMPGRIGELLGTGVTVENDVNLVALRERDGGAARDVGDFVLLWLSRGIGSAVVINHELLRGATGGAGEIDWMRVPDRAVREMGSDRSGVRFGDLLNSPSVVELARAYGLDTAEGAVAVGEALSAGSAGREFLVDLARRVATGLAGVVSVLDPQLVLLAAEVGRAGGDAFAELVAIELHRLVVPRTPVRPARIEGNPVRDGAVHVALDTARRQVLGVRPSPAGTTPEKSS